jgi:nucleotide-binding universal stress UspA family protein
MQSLSCILLLVERGERAHRGLNKALLLARHFGARLELLLCETARYVSGRANDSAAVESAHETCVTEGRHYLQALLQTIVFAGVEIGAQALCVPSIPEGVAEQMVHTGGQLIVKGARPGNGLATPLDWRILEQCGVPLLLTSGRPWRASPRFAAAVDLSDAGDRRLSTRLVGLCEALAHRCGAELDYLYATPIHERAVRARQMHGRLLSLLGAGDPGVGRLQYCSGEPSEVLPRLIARRDYDLLALGARHAASAARPDALLSRLVRAAGGDLLLLPGRVASGNTAQPNGAAMAAYG